MKISAHPLFLPFSYGPLAGWGLSSLVSGNLVSGEVSPRRWSSGLCGPSNSDQLTNRHHCGLTHWFLPTHWPPSPSTESFRPVSTYPDQFRNQSQSSDNLWPRFIRNHPWSKAWNTPPAPSIHPSIHPSFHPSNHPSILPSILPSSFTRGRKQKLFSQGCAPGDDTGCVSTPQCLPYFRQCLPFLGWLEQHCGGPASPGRTSSRSQVGRWWDGDCGGGNILVQFLWWWKRFGAVAVVVETFWCTGCGGGNILVQ